MIDELQLNEPGSFENALITFSPWRKIGANQLIVGQGRQAVEVTIDSGNIPFAISDTEIHEDVKGDKLPTRLAIELTDPVTQAQLTLTIRPVERP